MSAGDTLVAKFGADLEFVKSSGGVFEVSADESLVFSKKSLGRFPESGELVDLVQGRSAPGA